MDEMKEPEINYQNLTSQGGLVPEEYAKALKYARYLHAVAGYNLLDRENREAVQKTYSFLEKLPIPDQKPLLEQIVSDSLDMIVYGRCSCADTSCEESEYGRCSCSDDICRQ